MQIFSLGGEIKKVYYSDLCLMVKFRAFFPFASVGFGGDLLDQLADELDSSPQPRLTREVCRFVPFFPTTMQYERRHGIHGQSGAFSHGNKSE